MRGAGLTAARERTTDLNRPLGWALAALLAVVAVALAEHAWSSRPESASPALEPATLVPGYGPATSAEALAQAQSSVADKRHLLDGDPGSWLRMEGLARALLARARLTASAGDLAEANRLLERGVEAAAWPAGPVLSRAGAALAVHDLEGAEQALARLDASVTELLPAEAADARALRCEIAFERGQLDRATELCAGGDDLGLALRRANMSLAQGRGDEAAAAVEEVLRGARHSPSQLAALMLQRAGIALAAGEWEAAARWSHAADRAFPGYWLAEAFVAQSRALAGDAAGAERAYRAVARRTGDPDVYGALAVLAEARGDPAARRAYLAAAGRGWDARVRLLPETYGGHYGEYLALTGDVAGGLRAAGSDYRRRPYLQPMTDYVFVLDRAGRPGRIVEVVERGERAGFRSATLLLAKSEALARLGRAQEAARGRAAALRLNPRIEHPRQVFVHFRLD